MENKPHSRHGHEARDVILDLNFVPQWARKPPGENHYSKQAFDERPKREGRPPRREGRGNDRGGPRRPRRDEAPREERTPREPVKELPVEVSFLPEQKRLASLVRQIHHSRRAFPLMDLANLLIHDPKGYLVKIECTRQAGDFRLYQCRKCKSVTASEELMVQHIMSSHLEELYDIEEIEGEPPAGQFPGVARCTKTGILLGPPNHHSYNDKVAAVHAERFPNMPLEDYKRFIEIVKDEELVEQWKEESRKQTVYRLKSDPEAEPMDRKHAEQAFAKEVPSMYEKVSRAIVPSQVSQSLEDRDVTFAIRRVWSKESRFPLTLSFAMRAAFRHMHLHLFKAGKINFVTHIKPNPIKPEDTVPHIAEVLMFLRENPGSTRGQLLEVLHPSLDPASPEAKEALKPISWLVERGHLIEFFNGTLSVPLGRKRR